MAKSGRSKSGKKGSESTRGAQSTSRRKRAEKSILRRKRVNVGPAIYLGLMVVVMVGLALAVYLGN